MRVVVRVRPLETNGGKNIVCCDKNNKTITVQKPNVSVNEPPKVYQFDSVFGQESTQVSIFCGKVIDYRKRCIESFVVIMFVFYCSITMVPLTTTTSNESENRTEKKHFFNN